MPLLLLTIQLHHCADEARVRGDAEQSLRVRLGIDGVPEILEQAQARAEKIERVREWLLVSE